MDVNGGRVAPPPSILLPTISFRGGGKCLPKQAKTDKLKKCINFHAFASSQKFTHINFLLACTHLKNQKILHNMPVALQKCHPEQKK